MRWIPCASLGILIALLSAAPASADQIVDQSLTPTSGGLSYPIYNHGLGFLYAAQTFTVGRRGLLSEVDVLLAGPPAGTAPIADLTVQILATAAGVPRADSQAVLASSRIAASENTTQLQWVPADFSAAPLPVSPGEILAVALRVDQAGDAMYGWYGQSGITDPYPDGAVYQMDNGSGGRWEAPPGGHGDPFFWDMAFKTYVTVPEPGSSVAWVGCVTPLLVRQRRSHSPHSKHRRK